ncbi:MAG: mucoidy inhibitor MuiA family protein [Crocinitomicaceae bacterium]|nr:mucoidy inhibitor MuiA family protein [Crocinitomicaceae bacterium]
MNMHKIIFSAIVLLGFASVHAQNAKTINSRVTDVTVFLSGAQVTHTADVTLKSGENQVKLTDLPLELDPNSVQVEGNSDFTILSVRHNVNYAVDATRNPRIKALQDSLEDAQFRLQERTSLRTVYSEEKSMIQANRSIKGNDAVLITDDLGEMADFFRSRMKEVEYKLLEIAQQEKELNKEIARLQNQLNAQNARLSSNPSEILVTIQSPRDMKTAIRVSYLAHNAGWLPVYDLRAEDINSPIDFAYRARVYQSTGTDWENVSLTISTGNPTIGGQVPELYPWYINIYNPVAVYKKSEMKSRGDIPMAAIAEDSSYGYMTTGTEKENLSSSVYTSIQNNTVSTEFKISIPYDIPSDNQPYDVVMQEEKLKSNYSYVTIPKLDNDAFLRAQVTDWMQYSLLPGESNIYFRGTYVGKGYIDPALANDTLTLSLGRDKAIQVKREQIKDFCKTTVFGGKQKTTKAYEITVTNTKKQAVDIEVYDQLPISQNGELEVETEELSGGSYDAQTGKVTWKLHIEPGATTKKQLRFNAKYPKKKYISNL